MATLSDIFDDEKDIEGYNLVDFSQLTIATIMHTYKPEDKLDLDMIRHLVLSTIKFNVVKNKTKYPNIVLCIDNAEFGYWRRHMAYYYKKHRGKAKEESGWDWDTIHKSMSVMAKEVAEYLPYVTLNLPHTEADDCIGVMVKHLATTKPGTPILITSSDGDFTQCQRYPNVKQWSPILKKWVTPKHGSPIRDLLTKVVKGDKKDTIANVYMPSDFYITKEEGQRSKPVSAKLMARVYDAKDPRSLFSGKELERFDENFKLLDFELIPDNIRDAIIERFDTFKKPPRRLLYPYFVKNRLVKLAENIADF